MCPCALSATITQDSTQVPSIVLSGWPAPSDRRAGGDPLETAVPEDVDVYRHGCFLVTTTGNNLNVQENRHTTTPCSLGNCWTAMKTDDLELQMSAPTGTHIHMHASTHMHTRTHT